MPAGLAQSPVRGRPAEQVVGIGLVYLALVIDGFARTIVGWKVSSTASSSEWGRLRARFSRAGVRLCTRGARYADSAGRKSRATPLMQ